MQWNMNVKFDVINTLSSVAKNKKASSTFVFSLADVSKRSIISGMYSHKFLASAWDTSRKFSRSHLLPVSKMKIFKG